MKTPEKIFWDDAYSTGDPQVDKQHMVLFSMFNQLADVVENGASRAYMEKILDMLEYYATWHFSHEEDCMNKWNCPAAKKNKDAHVVFKNRVEKYKWEFSHTENMSELALRLHTEGAEWIRQHILTVDACLHSSIKR